MANRNWSSGGKVYSMHVKPVMIDLKVVIGASGAVTSFSGSTVLSVVRASAGIYTITLQPLTNFSKLFYAAGSMHSPSSGLSGIAAVEIQNAPDASIATAAGGILTVKCIAPTSSSVTTLTPTDPASGSVLNVLMICSDSSVNQP